MRLAEVAERALGGTSGGRGPGHMLCGNVREYKCDFTTIVCMTHC